MRRYLKLMVSAGALLLAAMVALSACTVVVEEPRPRPPSPGPSFCTMEYRPVCARRFDQRRTFSNSCLARQAGFDVIHSGSCGSSRPVACTREWAPVCATRNGSLRTFANSCEARSANWRIIRNGRC